MTLIIIILIIIIIIIIINTLYLSRVTRFTPSNLSRPCKDEITGHNTGINLYLSNKCVGSFKSLNRMLRL